MSYLACVDGELERIAAQGQYREIGPADVRYAADFSTNDYLALATDSRMVEAMRHVPRVGSGGARLLGGRHREHALLEGDLARWTGRDRALLFSSGYLAALGVIPVLASCVQTIYSDALNHASLIDGVRAAKIERVVYPHGALPARARRKTPSLVVSESLFGMDGDVVDPAVLLADLHDGDVLLIDDAHALGVFGTRAAGFAAALHDDRVVVLGTLGKAIGCAGGFIAGPERLIDLLVNRARTFVFDTAPPPAIAFAARVGVMLAQNADDRRARLFGKVARLREKLPQLAGAGATNAPIVSIPMGDETRAVAAMEYCLKQGVYAPAIRPPTVPAGSSRLRVSVRSDHTGEQIDLLAETLKSFECTAIS